MSDEQLKLLVSDRRRRQRGESTEGGAEELSNLEYTAVAAAAKEVSVLVRTPVACLPDGLTRRSRPIRPKSSGPGFSTTRRPTPACATVSARLGRRAAFAPSTRVLCRLCVTSQRPSGSLIVPGHSRLAQHRRHLPALREHRSSAQGHRAGRARPSGLPRLLIEPRVIVHPSTRIAHHVNPRLHRPPLRRVCSTGSGAGSEQPNTDSRP